MRRRTAGVAALGLVAMLIATAGAAADQADATSLELSSSPVVQEGFRNYAGPNCPGKGWNCTTASSVIQIASPGGVNRFECTDDTCTADQTGARNRARCDQRSRAPGAVLVCTITQTGHGNSATVKQRIRQRGGSFQEAKERVEVTQTANGAQNRARVRQTIFQRTREAEVLGSLAEQTQLADEFLDISQTGTMGADNWARATQRMGQRAKVNNSSVDFISQRQNTNDLDSSTPKNVHASIDQESDSGMNTLRLRQSDRYRELATSDSAQVTQRQGFEDGGLEASANQNGIDVTNATVRQRTRQRARADTAGPVFQTQIAGDPRCCSSFVGDPESTRVRVNQSTDQSASEGDSANQSAVFFGEFGTNGDGRLVQTATTNGVQERTVTECGPGTCSSVLVCGDAPGENSEVGIQQEPVLCAPPQETTPPPPPLDEIG